MHAVVMAGDREVLEGHFASGDRSGTVTAFLQVQVLPSGSAKSAKLARVWLGVTNTVMTYDTRTRKSKSPRTRRSSASGS